MGSLIRTLKGITARAAAPVPRAFVLQAMVAALLLTAHPAQSVGHAQERPEFVEASRVKAAYLYKFANYVEWPEQAFDTARSPLVIGVVDADALADELERVVAGRTIHDRPLEVRRVRRADASGDLHILYLGDVDARELSEFLHATRHQPTLTVTDSRLPASSGSMINFAVIDHRVRFEVSLPPARSAGISISALMLTAAYSVEQEAR